MAQYSRNFPTDQAIANALQRLADYFDEGQAIMERITVSPTFPVHEKFYTRVQLDMRVYDVFEDPTIHPAIAAQPRLPDIQGGPALSLSGGGYRIIEDARIHQFALPDNGGEETDATSK